MQWTHDIQGGDGIQTEFNVSEAQSPGGMEMGQLPLAVTWVIMGSNAYAEYDQRGDFPGVAIPDVSMQVSGVSLVRSDWTKSGMVYAEVE